MYQIIVGLSSSSTVQFIFQLYNIHTPMVVELGQMVAILKYSDIIRTVSVSNFQSIEVGPIECRLDSFIISLYLDTNTHFVN